MGLSNKIITSSISEQTGRFLTHANYICAFSQLMFRDSLAFRPRQPKHWSNLLKRIKESNALPSPTSNAIDLDVVRKSLHSAWGTEALLLMGKRIVKEDELLRLSNNWSVIQTYYVLYHCTQALHVAKGQACSTKHSAVQNNFYNLWASRPISLEPWSLAYGKDGVVNIPDGIQWNATIQNWCSCEGDNAWSLAVRPLRTTREKNLPDRGKQRRERKRRDKKAAWKEEEQQRMASGKRPRQEPAFRLPNLTKDEKTEVNAKLRPYTLIDYLYRLRIKTNYEDSNMFTDGPEDSDSSSDVRRHLCKIASGSLLLHELAVMNLVGRDKLVGWASKWVEKNLPENAGGIRQRLELL